MGIDRLLLGELKYAGDTEPGLSLHVSYCRDDDLEPPDVYDVEIAGVAVPLVLEQVAVWTARDDFHWASPEDRERLLCYLALCGISSVA